MGLFSTSLHIFRKDSSELISALKDVLNKKGLTQSLIELSSVDDYNKLIENDVYQQKGAFYLIAPKKNDWISILELNVSIENPFYLYEIATELSAKLQTIALAFHLHDGDVLYYNLENRGHSLDGYSSNLQYFEEEALAISEIESQRHSPENFRSLLPKNKSVEGLSTILNSGYWKAFDESNLDSDGIPNSEEYFIDEEERLETIGQYLEIHSRDKFPYADWHSEIPKLDLTSWYIIKGT